MKEYFLSAQRLVEFQVQPSNGVAPSDGLKIGFVSSGANILLTLRNPPAAFGPSEYSRDMGLSA